jgi:lipopolysaccharide/colanic/teichoic acid biosynthesis glycosyltransferase
MRSRPLPRGIETLPVTAAIRFDGAQAAIPAAAGDGRSTAIGEVIDLRDRPHQRVDRRAGAREMNPWWLRVVCGWHDAGRHAGPIMADLALVAGALLLTGSSSEGIAVGVSVLLVSGLLFGLWKRRLPYETRGVLWYSRHLAPAAAAVGFALAVGEPGVTTNTVALSSIVLSVGLIGARSLLWIVVGSARRRGLGLQDALVIGPAKRIDQIQHRLLTYPESGLRFAWGYSPEEGEGTSAESGRQLVNSLLAERPVDHVILVPDKIDESVLLDFVRFSKGQVDVTLVLPVATLSAGQVRSSIGDLGVLPLRLRPSPGSIAAKRAFDVVGSLAILSVLSPILLAISLLIRLSDGGPALFRQRRVGRNGEQFTILKFRSMVVGADEHQDDFRPQNFVNRGLLFKVDNDPRVTPVGAVLRRFSLDELPQFYNVLRGDMSLVGPRPLAVGPERFDIRAQIRHQVSPGVTGLWQALGANALEYSDMLDLDLAYVATRTFGVDFLTLLRTFPAVLVRRSPC